MNDDRKVWYRYKYQVGVFRPYTPGEIHLQRRLGQLFSDLLAGVPSDTLRVQTQSKVFRPYTPRESHLKSETAVLVCSGDEFLPVCKA
ncbi:hypothetical protein WDU94_012566 [Cyamophila willieti]